jgi:hypothetical protein
LKFTPKQPVPRFNRAFFDGTEPFTIIGSGQIGGKAQGLAFIRDTLAEHITPDEFPDVTVNIPRLVVVSTEVFDVFLRQNHLHETAYSDEPDDRIAHAFQRASFPAAFIGDLMALIAKVHQPLAVRSSSLLEDAMFQPFAGVYATKMTPNNQFDVETRFHKLVEAVKFVWASTFFKEAKAYIRSTSAHIEDEKMAVIIQEVVGHRSGERFYPHVSGVARSYNFYPMGKAKPEHGVVDLALGLGKTIVDGGLCWTYSPAFPRVRPPFGSVREMVAQTQSRFWAVNMGKPPAFDPNKETEYMVEAGIDDAEHDGALAQVASTYDPQADRLNPGIGQSGPRVLTFAPLLDLNVIPLNNLLKRLLKLCEEAVGAPVETEFAITFDEQHSGAARFGFLQVRPMVVSNETVDIANDDFTADKTLIASSAVLGNGSVEGIADIVYVKPETFEAKHTPVIAAELEEINKRLVEQKRPYLLIGFGRWGSSDAWLGIPVNWSQISGARAMVEATLPGMNVDLSQGSHFFHNLSSFQVSYFSVRFDGPLPIRWEWLSEQPVIAETAFVRHVQLSRPLHVRVDGRCGKGVITHD